MSLLKYLILVRGLVRQREIAEGEFGILTLRMELEPRTERIEQTLESRPVTDEHDRTG